MNEEIQLKNAIRILINGSINDLKGIAVDEVPQLLKDMVDDYNKEIKNQLEKIELENDE